MLFPFQYDKIIDNSIDYYIGLSENAIYYVNNVNSKYSMSSLDKIVLSRKRIISPNYSLNYFNPLSFIFDLEVRDITEYIKSTFFDNGDAYLDLESYLKSTKLTIYSYNRQMLVNIIFGINSMRRTCEECKVNIAYRWFLGLSMYDDIPNYSTWSQNYKRRYII